MQHQMMHLIKDLTGLLIDICASILIAEDVCSDTKPLVVGKLNLNVVWRQPILDFSDMDHALAFTTSLQGQ